MRTETIKIYLESGSRGLKEVELETKTIKAFVIPRAIIDKEPKKVLQLADLDAKPALYFLCQTHGDEMYIGNTTNFNDRKKAHHKEKDFWNIAIVFVAKDDFLTQNGVQFLEKEAIKIAQEANRFTLKNDKSGMKRTLERSKIGSLKNYFEDLKMLISTLGYPVFDVLASNKEMENDKWTIKNKNANASCIYDENGFTILPDSELSIDVAPSYQRRSGFKKRIAILESHTKQISKKIVVIKPIVCNSASEASCIVLGRASNGWTSWKNRKGETLDDVYRKK